MPADEAQLVLRDNLLLLSYLIATLTAGIAVIISLGVFDRQHWLGTRRVPGWMIGWREFGWFVLLVIGAVFAVQIMAAPLFSSAGGDQSIWVTIVSTALMAGAGIGAFLIARRTFRPEQGFDRLNSLNTSGTKALVWGVLAFLACLPLLFAVSTVWLGVIVLLQELGLHVPMEPQAIMQRLGEEQSPRVLFFLVVLAVVVAPVWEELVFRAGVYRFLKTRVRPWLAMTVSAALFSLVHFHPVGFPALMLVGIVLCLVYERSGDIRAAIAFHAFFNANTLIVFFLQGQPLPGAGN